jgi:hypothetical protein
MNNIEKQICDAIDIIATKAVADANYDRTIQATIASCEDATIGKYRVNYQDSTFYAYSNNSDLTYADGATVYVLIPANDMSAEKTIVGSTKKLGINYVTTIEQEDSYNIIGKNVLTSAKHELSSYYPKRTVKTLYDQSYTSSKNSISVNLTDVNNYIKGASSLLVAANIQTALPTEQQFRGNYGIIVGLDFLDNATEEEVTRYYILDVDAMSGNPYKLLNYTRQYAFFDIDGANFLRVSNISIFVENFPNSKEESKCVSDIFIKDIELCGAEALDSESINGSALTFLTLQGTYFDDTSLDSDTRSIKAQVRIKGKIADAASQNLSFYWFIEHSGITSQSQYYNKYGGQGWKCLNDFNVIQTNEDGDIEAVEWVPASDTYLVKKSDIAAKEAKYKCAVVYDGTVISNTIVINNLSSNFTVEIESDSGTQFYYDIGYPTLTCKVNGNEDPGSYTYSWSVTDNSGNFSSLSDTKVRNFFYDAFYNDYYKLLNQIENEEILEEANKEKLEEYRLSLADYDTVNRVASNKIYHINVNTITNFSTYTCTVYSSDTYIGSASIVLTNSLEAEGQYSLVINEGNKVYKYNENGISPASSSLDSPIDIQALSISVYDNKGQQLSDNILAKKAKIKWLVPVENTMIELADLPDGWSYTEYNGVRTYTANSGIALSFPYKISGRYNLNYINNDITVVVDYQEEDVHLINKTNLTFIKEGESGTNGTEFVCKLVPNIISGEIQPTLPMVTEDVNGQWKLNYTPVNAYKFLKVQLWHNDEKILDSVTSANTTEGKEATIKWSILKNKYTSLITDNSAFEVGEESGVFQFNGYMRAALAPANIVKATVIYDGVTYYAFLPIVTAKISNEDYLIKLKDNTGFYSVVYSSDGQTPKYNNTVPFEAIITQNIDGYWENVSNKNSSEYQIEYEWNCGFGAIYEDSKWVNVSAFNQTSGATTPNTYMIKPVDSYDGQCVTHSIEVVVTKNSNEVCRMHIPIHLMLNRFGNSAINGWDGNSVQVDDEGGFILAPQVGAGIKEDDNSFTGVVMGKVKETNQSSTDIGLIGYAKGTRSIFLDAQSGKAEFGANGNGQIVIDPTNNKAEIYSGNYEYNSDGSGTGLKIDLTAPTIKFGSGNFEVNESGKMVAKGGGSIAGWQIGETELYSPAPYSSRKITLDAENSKIYSGTKTEGNKSEGGFYLGTDFLSLGSQFKVRNTGVLEIGVGAVNTNPTTKYWTISGEDTGSYIKYGTKGNTGSVYIGTSELQLGKGLWANSAGLMKVGNLNGTYWTIAGKTNGESPAFISYNHDVTYDGNGELTSYPTISSDHASSSMYLGTDGISIGSRFLINADNSGSIEIMSNAGSGLNDTTNGFYLNSSGFRVGNKFKVTNGVLNVGSLSGKNWTINGNTNRAYIAYGGTTAYSDADSEDSDNADIYLGTDGISLGKRFSVDKQGKLIANSGTVGGWTLSSSKFTGGSMEINSEGSIKGGSTNSWSIDKEGKASFSNIAITGGSLNVSDKAKINTDGSASFSNVTISGGSLNINNKAKINTDGSASFTNISVTGGKITLGGATIDGSTDTLKLTASKTSIGTSSLNDYIENLSVNSLKAAKFTLDGNECQWQKVEFLTKMIKYNTYKVYDYTSQSQVELYDLRFNRASMYVLSSVTEIE